MKRTYLNHDRFVPSLLTILSNKLAIGAASIYRTTHGVNAAECRVVLLLGVEPGIPAQRMRQVIGIDKALISRTVRSLRNKKYVTVVADDNDSRRSTVALTSSGLLLHDRLLKIALERERLLLADFNEKEIDVLIGLLHRMLGRVDAANAYAVLPKLATKARSQAR